MYKNIGMKIMKYADGLSKVAFALNIVGGILYFFENPILAVIYTAIGWVAIWVSSACLYGFGALISEASAIRETNDRILDILESKY